MKKLAMCLVVFALIVGSVFAQGTEETKTEKPLTIGISLSSWTSNSVFIDVGNKLRAYCAENGYKLIENSLTTDTIVTTLENFISAGCDIVIVQANQAPDAVKSMLPRLHEAGIVVACYDYIAFQDEPCVIYSATCENYDAGFALGKAAAEWANANIKGHVKAAVLNRESNETFRFRGYGIEDALRKYLKDGKVYASINTPGNATGGMKSTEDTLSAVPGLNLLVTWNGGSGVGAYEALRGAGSDVALFTCDASQEEIKCLLNGDYMKGSLDLDLANQVLLLFTKSVEYVKNGKQYPAGETEHVWYYPLTIVTPETAKDYLL